ADDVDALPLEMLVPMKAARIKQLSDLLRHRIDTREIARFEEIAVDAGRRQIVQTVVAAVLAGTDVLDVQGCERRLVLAQTTVFAGVACPFTDLASARGVDHLGGC